MISYQCVATYVLCFNVHSCNLLFCTGEGSLLKPSQDASIEKRASYTNGQVSSVGSAGYGFDDHNPMQTEFTQLHISSSQQKKSNDRDALLCDTD